jgi:hypothetical protein
MKRRPIFMALAAAVFAFGRVRSANADEPLPPLPSPAAEAEEPPPPHAAPHARPAPPPAEDESRFVEVTIDSPSRGVALQALTPLEGYFHVHYRWHHAIAYGRAYRWEQVCRAPCTIRVPPDLRYRIAGPNVPASDVFILGPPGSQRHLQVQAGSVAGQLTGALLLVVGIPSTAVGVIVAASTDRDATRVEGFVTAGIGLGLSILGAILVATNGTTLSDENGRTIAKQRGPVSFSPSGLLF